MPKTLVELFKLNGKFYTSEHWEVPEGAIGPWDMKKSRDFRRIAGGPVLISSDSEWGYPYLIMPEV